MPVPPPLRDVEFTIERANGERVAVSAGEGDTLLEVCQDNGLDEVEGVCGGACSCTTCHIILSRALFDALPPPGEDELDRLDLAVAVEETSRLGCQVQVDSDRFGGTVGEVRIPAEFLNLYQDT